VCGEPA